MGDLPENMGREIPDIRKGAALIDAPPLAV
jgi:hypothetical protein